MASTGKLRRLVTLSALVAAASASAAWGAFLAACQPKSGTDRGPSGAGPSGTTGSSPPPATVTVAPVPTATPSASASATGPEDAGAPSASASDAGQHPPVPQPTSTPWRHIEAE
ncbi:MAG: hypothetical protein IT373_32300 [Polyangiaceae bacterium]|nr:hypothetical protein [Polyangiaceae bacterium]